MKKILLFIFIAAIIAVSAAHDIFEGFLPQGEPCFKVMDIPPTCNKTLAESFEPRSAKVGTNERETLAFLFTPDNPDVAEPLHLCGGKLPTGTTFDPKADTEIFIHGWLDGVCRTAWMREMKEQLVIRGRYNVILMDWTWGNTPDYFHAGQNCKIVGEQAGFIINNIMNQTRVGADRFHITGHSLGAIAGGYAGRTVKGLRRITGLDPAFAPYGDAPPKDRLTYRDAQIVDVIHTNAPDPGCFALGIGDPRPMGRADFYPNGGFFQLGCIPYILTSLLKGDILNGIFSLEPRICSHNLATVYYKVSINPGDCQFIGEASESYESYEDNKKYSNSECSSDRAVMGMDYEKYITENNTDPGKKYYLDTTILCPYCKKCGCRNLP